MTLELNCWVLGDDPSSVFDVEIAGSKRVTFLKKTIKDENPHTFRDIDAKALKLWKLLNPVSQGDIVGTLGGIVDGAKIPNALHLESMNKLSFYFSAPVPGMLHLVIQVVPAGITISPSNSAELGLGASISPSNSAELGAHEEPIETNGDEVPPPKRLKLEGDSSQEERRAKLQSPQFHPRDGDVVKYQNTWRYLWGQNRFETVDEHSTILNLDHVELPQLNPRERKFLLVREEYTATYDVITQPADQGDRSIFLVTGQPGIGKTFFLMYLLARLLGGKQIVCLQTSLDSFIIFDEGGATRHKADSGVPDRVWALSDSVGHGQMQPCLSFQYSKAHVVHTSSPARRNWKHWVKNLSANEYVMDMWDEQELQQLLSHSGLNITVGLALFRKYGSNIRGITDMLYTPEKEDVYHSQVRRAAAKFAKDYHNILGNLDALDYSGELSSLIFAVKPTSAHNDGRVIIPTDFLSATLGVALSRAAEVERQKAFMMLHDHPSLSNAAGWIFEHSAHLYVANNDRPKIPIYMQSQEGPAIPPVTLSKSGNTFLGKVQAPYDFYWRPREVNFPGVDALIRRGNEVWLLQYTISRTHKPADEGLSRVRGTMNGRTGVKWYLVILGSNLADAENARRTLASHQSSVAVYAGTLPLQWDERLLEEVGN